MENLSSIKDTLGNLKAPIYSSTELNSSFKQAAQAISLLYTESSKASKRAYNTGYYCALQDVLEFLQQSLDSPPTTEVNTKGKKNSKASNVGNVERMASSVQAVMNYIEARQQACRLLSEDDPLSDLLPVRSTSPSKPNPLPTTTTTATGATSKSAVSFTNPSFTPTPSSPIRSPSPLPIPPRRHPSSTSHSHTSKRHSRHPNPSTSSSNATAPITIPVTVPLNPSAAVMGLKRRRSPSSFGMPIRKVGNEVDVDDVLVGNGSKESEEVVDMRMDEDERPNKKVARR